MKKNKLSIDKFRILEMSGLSDVQGGTGLSVNTTVDPKTEEMTYNESLTTTYTTNPDVPCQTADTNNGNVTIPTFLIM